MRQITNLQGMFRVSKTSVRLPGGISWQPLTIKPHAQLTISDKVEDGNTVWTAKLVFKTCEEFGDRGSRGQILYLGTMGSDVEVLAPDWFREDTAERVKDMWDKYRNKCE